MNNLSESLCKGLTYESNKIDQLWDKYTQINKNCIELFNFLDCDECGKRYTKNPEQNNVGVCNDCYLKGCISCKECNKVYYISHDQIDYYYDNNDSQNYYKVCSNECNLHWECHRRGDSSDMWYDDGHSGYNSYTYHWKRIEDIRYLDNKQISNDLKYAYLKKRINIYRDELLNVVLHPDNIEKQIKLGAKISDYCI
jgi:hypothetical protein